MTEPTTVSLVVDASAIVAAVADLGPAGAWASEALLDNRLAAPSHMPFEAMNILRREAVRGALEWDIANAYRRKL